MFVFYIWIALVIFFTLANRKYRIAIERDENSGKLVLNYYVGNYLMQRLRTSLQLLGGERFEVRNTTLGGGVSEGGRSHSVTAYAVCMIRNRRVLLEASAIQNRNHGSIETLVAGNRPELSPHQVQGITDGVGVPNE